MTPQRCNRRNFLTLAGSTLAAGALRAQTPSLAHISVAQLEHDRVLAEAKNALNAPIAPVIATHPPQGSADLFFSEMELDTPAGVNTPTPFRAHAHALREFSATVACLSAAFALTNEPNYVVRAGQHVRASLLTPTTRLQPNFDHAGCDATSNTENAASRTGTPAGIVDLLPLAELARALVFLLDSPALASEEWEAVHAWFKAAHDWLNSNRAALIARDRKDHRGSAWLLLAAAFARFGRDENALEAYRKLFRKPTLRNQIRTDGVFPQEVATANPYRNTLFNFDLLAGACQLLNSPFDPLWTYELIDSVGLRMVAAYLYPVVAHPERWGFVADASHFRELPGRRAGLLFAGRAYDRPEYVALWQQLPVIPISSEIAGTVPIQQPMLWTARAPHGL